MKATLVATQICDEAICLATFEPINSAIIISVFTYKRVERTIMKIGPKLKTKSKSIVYATILIVTLAGAALFNFASASRTPDASPIQAVRTLVVETQSAILSDQYTITKNFVGRAEAARNSKLGFELSGQVIEVFVDDGQRVKTGQTIALLDTKRLLARQKELEAAKSQASARLMLAQLTLTRMQTLIRRNAISQQQFDEARFEKDVQLEAVRTIESQIARIQIDIQKSRLLAPYDGIVAQRLVDEGTVIQPGEVIVELLETDRMEIRVGVDPVTAETLGIGQVLKVSAGNHALDAEITSVLPLRNSQTRTVSTILSVTDDGKTLRHGDLIEIPLKKTVEEAGFWLPRNALTENARGLWSCFVAVPIKENLRTARTIERRELELIYQENDRVYVRGTLSDGEAVVVNGLHRLVPGQNVKIQ